MGSSSSSPVSSHGVDVSCAQPTANGWWASLALGGRLYGVPCNAERLLVYDPNSRAVSSVDTKHVATGKGKWRAAVALGGRIYGIPDHAEQLLVFDVSSGRAFGYDTRAIARGSFKWQAALTLGGKIYGIPHHAEKMFIYDPRTDQMRGEPTGCVAVGLSKWVAGVAVGGKIYGVPCNAPAILVYNPVTGRVGGVDVKHLASGKMKWLSAVSHQGKLYGIPCHAECLLVYDPATAQAWGVDTTSVARGPGKWLSAVAVGAKIYGIPDHADRILVYDVASGIVSGVDVSTLAPAGPYKWQSGIAMGGRVYAMPFNADAILCYDPSTGEASGVSVNTIAAGNGKWGMAVALNGLLYGMPYDAAQLLVHQPQHEEQSGAPSRSENLPSWMTLEYTEDFVAAWLSEWIYSVEDIERPCQVPPLSIADEPVGFCVHRIYEDPLQGAPARLATVSVTFPHTGQAVYLIFKGTSFLKDLVSNASISPDYTPFHHAFQDNTTFIHHGAHYAMAQLRVHQWDSLLDQLLTAQAEGTSRVIVAGHSLGGQYAMAFMLQVFLEYKVKQQPQEPDSSAPEGPEALLQQLRCVSFGSPMCFGAAEGTTVRADFARFMNERSVNYIHAGDPAPRLWSELDLEDFMRYFVNWIQGQISSFSRRLMDYYVGPGGLVRRFEEVLQLPDIEVHLLRPAARYVHVSRIRILGDEFRPWRPLGHEDISLEDHRMYEGYTVALRSAFDPSALGTLFSEDGQELVEVQKLSRGSYP